MKTLKKAGVAAIGLSAALLSCNALAVSWQTLTGTNVTYVYDADNMGLYGTPSLSGNSLIFTPTNFKAVATDGGTVLTSSTINIRAYTNSNYSFSSFNLTELGDYALVGDKSQVSVSGQIRLFDLANPPPAGLQLTDSITPTASLNVTTTLANLQTTNWQANAAIAVPTGWSNGVNLTIQNILVAHTEQLGGLAFVEKKFVGSAVVLTPVPEAQTYAMMLVGLGLVGFMVGRKRHVSA